MNEYEYDIGDVVKIYFLSKWRVAIILERKQKTRFTNEYELLISGIPNTTHMYYEDEIKKKL